eukprot:TRINITY_DN5440_c0_g1_i1.p1 TRINITY_DN5440_c0_g1~~TRINITY_DN5440_c0_g1_i1.p1  ORF type:complete len:764 (+),score=278.03 TRINITY_DN5440_c0_g1_i1:108-2294(+)
MSRAQDDFYMYMNQKWLEAPENQIPPEYPRWGGFIKLHDTGLKDQIELVKGLNGQAARNEEETKIGAIWGASTKRFDAWRAGDEDYKPIMKEIEVMKAMLRPSEPVKDQDDLVDRVAKYAHYCEVNGITNVFNFDTSPDFENSNNVVLTFNTKGLSLPDREYYFDDKFAEKLKMWKTHLTNVKKLLEGSVDLPENWEEKVHEFETELAKYKMKKEQARNYHEYYTNTTMAQMYGDINNLRSEGTKNDNYDESERNFTLSDEQTKDAEKFFKTMYSLFNLEEVMKANLDKHYMGDKPVENPPKPDHVTAFDGDAIRRVLCMVFNTGNFDKYIAFLMYKVITAFKGFCTKDIDEEYFDLYQRKLHGQKEQKPEDKRTIGLVNGYAGEMLGKVYVAKFFPEDCKAEVKGMIAEVVDVMRESMKANDWLTESTKAEAVKKLDKFVVKIGYPDVWKDYSLLDIKEGDGLYEISKKSKKWSLETEFYKKLNTPVDKTEWLITPQTVNAYFNPTQNEIVFPAAILQAPFYCRSASLIDFDIAEEQAEFPEYDFTMAVNFGGIGAVIAHEITHGYDDQGRRFNGDGNLDEWWSAEDVELFTKKTDLMKDQAGLYVFTDETDGKEHKLKPGLVLGEALADLGGLSLSLQALTKRLVNSGASPELIKANHRVFFKSFANIWKENTSKDFLINAIANAVHPPVAFRANLVANIAEFYTSFDVKEGDRMYIAPEKRLRMW